MKIRAAQKGDSGKITGLWQEAFPEDDKAFMQSYLGKKLKSREIVVATEGCRFLGFLSFSRNFFPNADYNEFVVVNPEFRRKGVASALMKWFEQQARKNRRRRIYSSTWRGHSISLNMHRKLGYERAGFVEDMWAEGQRELMFSKKLRK